MMVRAQATSWTREKDRPGRYRDRLTPCGIIQRRRDRSSTQHKGAHREQVEIAPPSVDRVLRTGGQLLDGGTRRFFEPRFGRDFSNVRVHTDPTAAESALEVRALGYTVGSHVVFASAQYRPGTRAGLELIGHELAHVVQQTGPSPRSPMPALASANRSALKVGAEGDACEHEADRAAKAALSGTVPVALRQRTAGVLQREQGSRTRSRRRHSEAELRYMGTRPSFALHYWLRLDQSQRDTILWQVINRYGPDFALQFLEYANRRRQPVLVTNYTNFPSATPRSLTRSGYRYAGDLNGLPTWVHPSGREVVLVPRSRPPRREEEEEEEDERTPFERRCVDPCLLDTEDEAECRECCARIPESDARCRRACNVSCDMKI